MIGHLQQLHEQYKDKGLVMLGVNVSDSRDTARAFLASYHVTFPNIADTSQQARAVFDGQYRSNRGAVPCEYIINRDGKVYRAWYGSGGNSGETAIQELGIR